MIKVKGDYFRDYVILEEILYSYQNYFRVFVFIVVFKELNYYLFFRFDDVNFVNNLIEYRIGFIYS